MYIPIPAIIPFEIEEVKGIRTMVVKAGTASLILSQSIPFTTFIIITPIIIKDGPIAHSEHLLKLV